MTDAPTLEAFPYRDYDKLRYGDLDTLGHVNNVVFATLCSTGRVGLLGQKGIDAWTRADITFVIARLELDYRNELLWPGTVESGTGITAIGNASLRLFQGLYQGGKLAALARTVMVQVDAKTHRPVPITPEMRAVLDKFLISS